MMDSYWSRFGNEQLSRRRVLAATGASATAAALLAACGGGQSSSSGGDKAGKASLVIQPVDTTKQSNRGRTFKTRTFADPGSLDINTPNNPITPFANDIYSSLVLLKPGYLAPAQEELAPDIAESWEYSPDGLT